MDPPFMPLNDYNDPELGLIRSQDYRRVIAVDICDDEPMITLAEYFGEVVLHVSETFADTLSTLYELHSEMSQFKTDLMVQNLPFFPHVANVDTDAAFGTPWKPLAARTA
jgi:hypothetical protein